MDQMAWVLGVGIAVVVVLGVAEAVARYLLSHVLRRYSKPPNLTQKIFPHEGVRRYLSDEVENKTNRDGERGNDPAAVKHLYRVLLLGGSNAACDVLSWRDSIGGHLETLLSTMEARAALGVEAAHVGVIAHSQLDSAGLLHIMRNVLPGYKKKLDTILIMIGVSDLLLWLEANAPAGALHPASDKRNWVLNHPDMEFKWKRPALVLLAWRIKMQWFGQQVERRNLGRYMVNELAARKAARPHLRIEADVSALIAAYERNLREAIELGRAHARRVIVIRQQWLNKPEPTAEEDAIIWGGRLGKPKGDPLRFIEYGQMCELLGEIDRAAARVAERSGVECVHFKDYPEQRIGVYYDHAHYTALGAHQAAEVLARQILAAGSNHGA
jgi:hypothetical protein